MTDSPVRDALALLAKSKSPDSQATASALLEYLETRNPEIILKIPAGSTRTLGAEADTGSPATVAVRDCLGHLDSDAILEVVALLIGVRRYQDALVHPRFSGGFGNAIAFAGPRQKEGSAAQAALIAAGARVGVPDEELARYMLLEHSHHLHFGWRTIAKANSTSSADPRNFKREFDPSFESASIFEKFIWNLPEEALARLALAEQPSPWSRGTVRAPSTFVGALAASKPGLLGAWLEQGIFDPADWQHLLAATEAFDMHALRLAEMLLPGPRLQLLVELSDQRPGEHLELTRKAALEATGMDIALALEYLAEQFPEDLSSRFAQVVLARKLTGSVPRYAFEKVCHALAIHWDSGGKGAFEAVVSCPFLPIAGPYDSSKPSLYSYGIGALLKPSRGCSPEEVRAWASAALDAIAAANLEKKEQSALYESFWTAAVLHDPSPLCEELFVLLGDKLKTLRQLAVVGLMKVNDPSMVTRSAGLLSSGKLDQKLGATALLAAIGNPAAMDALTEALASEGHEKVRAAIHEGLEASKPCTGASENIPEVVPNFPFADIEALIEKQASKLRIPPVDWLKLVTLPALSGKDGTVLSSRAIAYLIAKQAKHKPLEAAPDILPLLDHVDRETSAPFAAALVERFLDSEQSAADRWALTLGGLLGDKRIINLLLPRIQGWCENSRHKLAEYAAQAISLLPGNEPLMVLDSLSNRYRSKFKNVGRACAEAFTAAATARGITADELGDMVVPDFGFDAEGIRRFDWGGGGISAELGADFKLSWFDPETEKSWKSLPANAPGEVKEEVKSVTKLIREVVKGQTTRLEMSLVRQRRWSVARWKELFENHPLLRSFASGLVWGVYDAQGQLLRSFRRYANGILADAAGGLEELPEADSVVGMIHPLELSPETLNAWRGHFARMKVKQPFPQLARPVEIMDPLHGNRREISLTTDRQISAGTFRSRAEKRGWTRGSVVDAGGIASYYKLYPGAGVEVNLPLDGFYIGCDPMETITLSAAYFAKAGSVERGSYIYDEPAPDDPRVLRFDQVTPVVFSETIGDLKAIIATKE